MNKNVSFKQMAQTISSKFTVAAMVCLMDLNSADITVADLGKLEDGSVLTAPFQGGRKIVIDLTPEEDTWLDITEVNAAILPHHAGHDTQSLHIAVHLNTADSFKLESIEKKIQKAHGYSVLRNNGKTWVGMHQGEGKVVLNIVLENSAAPTPLRFIQDGAMKKGFGKVFLDECLQGACLKDFHCKAKVELECIHETAETINVTLTVCSIVFTPMLKRNIVDYSLAEEEAFIRASKRLKYAF